MEYYPEHPSRSNPPYWLGIFCLIPFIGAIVGITLFFMGIIKYRNKWLAVMGLLGIALTIYFSVRLYHKISNIKTDPTIKKALSSMSQMQLNGLVKDIEFYKLQCGAYPETLDDLKQVDSLAQLYDMNRVMHGGHTSTYNYKLEGEKYELFSSGPDGIPNTKDDIYPAIIIRKNSKIGLILPADKTANQPGD